MNARELSDLALAQFAAESYLHGIDLNDAARRTERLVAGNNDTQHPYVQALSSEEYPGATRMTEQQITRFNETWEVKHHLPNTWTGFSATLMKHRTAGTYVLSFRSTEFQNDNEGGDWGRDGMVADPNGGAGGADNEISVNGFAIAQIADAEAYFRFLRASGFLPTDAKYQVTGYSLGGHLAAVFAEAHAGESDFLGATVFNAPGRGALAAGKTVKDLVERAHDMLAADNALLRQGESASGVRESIYNSSAYVGSSTVSGSRDAIAAEFHFSGLSLQSTPTALPGNITSVYGLADMNDSTWVANAGFHSKDTIKVYIEDQPDIQGFIFNGLGKLFAGLKSDFGTSHSITLIADSLAVAELMQVIDSQMTQVQINDLLPVMSNERGFGFLGTAGTAESASLERFIEAVALMYKVDLSDAGIDPAITNEGQILRDDSGGSFGNLVNRNAFWNAISLVRAQIDAAPGGTLVSLKGLAGSAIADEAKSDTDAGLAYRYALVEGNSFAVVKARGFYGDKGHLADRRLDLYSAGGHLTDSYIEDRAAFVERKTYYNVENARFDKIIDSPNPGDRGDANATRFDDENVVWEDKASGVLIRRKDADAQTQYRGFGGADDDVLTGGLSTDRLYGGGGGVDTLTGGKGNDYLEGGLGSDTYVYATGDGLDTIVDSDGQGSIRVDGATFEGATGMGDDRVFQWTDGNGKRRNYVFLTGDRTTGGDLLLDNRVIVKNFRGGDLGIALADVQERPLPITTVEINANLKPKVFPVPEGVHLTLGPGGVGEYVYENFHAEFPYVFPSVPLLVLNDSPMGPAGRVVWLGGAVSGVDAEGKPFPGGPSSYLLIDPDAPLQTSHSFVADAPGAVGDGSLIDTANNDHIMGSDGRDFVGHPGLDPVSGDDLVELGQGDDYASGDLGDDVLVGGEGLDQLSGDLGHDRVYAGDRIELKQAIARGNTESGTGGTQWLYGDHYAAPQGGDDWVIGDTANDLIMGGGGSDVLVGGAGDDDISGDNSLNFYSDLPLSDPNYPVRPFRPESFGGGFKISWEPEYGYSYLDVPSDGGADVIYAGNGNDVVWGGAGNDVILGEAGSDRLTGDGDDDTILGGEGNDYIWGDGGMYSWLFTFNLISGTDSEGLSSAPGRYSAMVAGNDYLDGGEGDDIIYGGGGDDVLVGGAGTNKLEGGAGRDTYIFTAGSVNTVVDSGSNAYVFGEGFDQRDLVLRKGSLILDFGAGGSVHIEGFDNTDPYGALAGTEFQFADGGTLSVAALLANGIELEGTDGDDFLDGSAAPERIRGKRGADVLSGGGGSDVYYFDRGDGEDWILDHGGDSESNTLILGAGFVLEDMRAQMTSWMTVRLDLGEGDSVDLGAAADLSVQRLRFADGAEMSIGDLFDQVRIEQTGTDGDDVLTGTTFGDRLEGGAGFDVLVGDTGSDILIGGGPEGDELVGGLGDDTYVFNAGDGFDYIFDEGGFDTLEFGAGIQTGDLVVQANAFGLFVTVGGAGNGVFMASWATPENQIEQFKFADGTVWDAAEVVDHVSVAPATPLDDLIFGDAADNVIDGLEGDDQVGGGSGNDILSGSDGNDSISGDGGHNLLLGGSGDDSLFADNDSGRNLFIGGAGYDGIQPQLGGSIVAFNFGDGEDSLFDNVFNEGAPFVLSLGQVLASEIVLSLSGDTLRIGLSATDGVSSYAYAGDPASWPDGRLQIIGDDVRTYDLDGIVADFHAARAEDPTLSEWSIEGVLEEHLLSISTTQALGGVLAFQYATTGAISLSPAQIQAVLADTGFGIEAQDIGVASGNQAPEVANPIEDRVAAEDSPFAFMVHEGAFADADAGDALTYSASLDDGSVLPSWLSFDAATRTFSGTPLQADVGAIEIRVRAADQAGLYAEDVFRLDVAAVNDAPVLVHTIADQNATAGSPFVFTFASDVFADVDQDGALAYTATMSDGSALPSWLAFDAATRTFAGTPPAASAGALQIRVTATDVAGAGTSDEFSIGVAAGNDESGELIIGTDRNDVLAGTAYDDVIDGREGFDRMSGGKGNDIYFVDATGSDHGGCRADEVIEAHDGGHDVVYALADYTLAPNVEEVHLLGRDNLDATGNALANVLEGNAGNNVLSGGAGADTYIYSFGDGADTIDEKGVAAQLDTLKLQGMAAGSVRLKRSNDDLIVDFPGRDGRVTLRKWFASSASRVERFQFDDGTVWDEATIRSRVGRPVSAAHHEGHGSHGHSQGHHHGDHRAGGHDREEHRGHRDRRDDGERRDGVDEAIGKRLKNPVRFDFEEVTRALNPANGGRVMTAQEIARRWAEVQSYTARLADCDDDGNDAGIAQIRDLFGVAAPHHGNSCFGFEGSTGASQGPDRWLKALQGLGEGFRNLC